MSEKERELHLMEIPAPLEEYELCEVTAELAHILSNACTIRWEVRPLENRASYKLIAHVTDGFKILPHVVLCDE